MMRMTLQNGQHEGAIRLLTCQRDAKHDPVKQEFKARVVLEAIREEMTLAEISRNTSDGSC